MNLLDQYIEYFGRLKTAYSKRGPAPHKALLLLSVIDLIENGEIMTTRIELSDNLINVFNSNAQILFKDDFFKPSIGQPFFFMKSEPFWQLIPYNLADVDLKSTSYSIKNLRGTYQYALIDTALLVLLQDAGNRELLRELLIEKYILSHKHI